MATVGTPWKSFSEAGIMSPDEIKKREEDLKQRMKEVDERAKKASFEGSVRRLNEESGNVISTPLTESSTNKLGQALSGQFAQAEEAGLQAQRQAFPNRGVVTTETDPQTNQQNLVRTGAQSEVRLADPTLSASYSAPVGAEEAISQLEAENARATGAFSEEQIEKNMNTFKLVGRAGGRFIEKPRGAKYWFAENPEAMEARKIQLAAVERKKNLGTDFVASATVDNDITAQAGRRRQRGRQSVPNLSPEEIGVAAEKAAHIVSPNLSLNGEPTAPLTEQEYQGVKFDLQNTTFGKEYIRVRENKEQQVDNYIEENLGKIQTTNDVEALIDNWATDLYVGDYASKKIGEAIKEPEVANRIRLGDKDLSKEQQMQKYTRLEASSNLPAFASWASKPENGRLGIKESRDLMNKVLQGDEQATAKYNTFKQESDHVKYSDTGDVTTVSISKEKRERIEKNARVMRIVSRGQGNMNNPEEREAYENAGLSKQDVSILENKESLLTKDFPTSDTEIVISIPDDVSEEGLAGTAYARMQTDGISLKQAINDVVDDTNIDTDTESIKAIKHNMAKSVISFSEGNMVNIGRNKVLEEREQFINFEENTADIRDKFNTEDNGASPAFASELNGLQTLHKLNDADVHKAYLLGVGEPGTSGYEPGLLGKLSPEEYKWASDGIMFTQAGDIRAQDYGIIRSLYQDVERADQSSSQFANRLAEEKLQKETAVSLAHLRGLGFNAVSGENGATLITPPSGQAFRVYSVIEDNDIPVHFVTKEMADTYRQIKDPDDREIWLDGIGSPTNGVYVPKKGADEVNLISDMLTGNDASISSYMSIESYNALAEIRGKAYEAKRLADIAPGSKVTNELLEDLQMPKVYRRFIAEDRIAVKAMEKWMESGDPKYYNLAYGRAHQLGTSVNKQEFNFDKIGAVNLYYKLAKDIGAFEGMKMSTATSGVARDANGKMYHLRDPKTLQKLISKRVKNATYDDKRAFKFDEIETSRALAIKETKGMEKLYRHMCSSDGFNTPLGKKYGYTIQDFKDLEALKQIHSDIQRWKIEPIEEVPELVI